MTVNDDDDNDNNNNNNNTIRKITITITMAIKTAKTTLLADMNIVIASASVTSFL